MTQYILALDQGTTSSRALLVDHAGAVVGMAQQEFTQYYPHAAWVEHDANEILSSQLAVARQVMAQNNVEATQIAAIGITNQRETTVLWDTQTGQPIHHAIVWQDRRTAAICAEFKAHEAMIQEKTGLILDAYFSATKIAWLLNHVDGARELVAQNRLAFGTMDSWLIWHLSGGALHITDASNASRTLLFNIHTGEWDDELLALFDIPRNILPSVRDSSDVYGQTTEGVFDTPIALAGIAGDQQAALFGQMCVSDGMVKNTYGTGCFMMMNTGAKLISSQHRLLTTIAWRIDGQTVYALEGSVFVAGALVQWLRDGLGIIGSAQEIQALAMSVDSSDGVVVVPAFTGLGAPHWQPNARGTLFGVTRGTTRAHIARAALEAIAQQTADVLQAMQDDAGTPIVELRVDGGAAANDALMQMQADLFDTRVMRPQVLESTALGAAYLAGLAVGFWANIDELKQQWQVDRVFQRAQDAKVVQGSRKNWARAVRAVNHWAEDEVDV